MAAERSARATWRGDLMSGSGMFSLASGAVSELPVSWAARTESSDGKTSPEELIAAALASCFSMALAHGLAQGGHAPTQLDTEATATFDKTDAGFRMTTIALKVRGQVDGVDEAGFREAAEGASQNCPVSKVLAGNVDIELDAALA